MSIDQMHELQELRAAAAPFIAFAEALGSVASGLRDLRREFLARSERSKARGGILQWYITDKGRDWLRAHMAEALRLLADKETLTIAHRGRLAA